MSFFTFTGRFLVYTPVKVSYSLPMEEMIYFDNNSTTFLLPEVKEALHDLINLKLGNPESIYSLDSNSKELIEESRQYIAQLLGTKKDSVIFTSSGSESNAMAIYSALAKESRKKIVSSQIEHTSIDNTLELLAKDGYEILFINTLQSGTIDLDHAEKLIDEDTALVIVQLINNETGVIQPIEEIKHLVVRNNTNFLCDSTQAVGKYDFNLENLGCNFFTCSAHKFHGPFGVGILWTNEDKNSLYPLIPGGSQEYGVRGGTHNIFGIVGAGVAAKLKKNNLEKSINYISNIRDDFETALLENIPNILINGAPSSRVCNTTNVQFRDINGKALFLRLIDSNILCSQSSSCTAQYPEASKTLLAMGLSSEEAFNSIRFSFSELNFNEEILRASKKIVDLFSLLNNKTFGGW